jgi:hypothetical protein
VASTLPNYDPDGSSTKENNMNQTDIIDVLKEEIDKLPTGSMPGAAIQPTLARLSSAKWQDYIEDLLGYVAPIAKNQVNAFHFSQAKQGKSGGNNLPSKLLPPKDILLLNLTVEPGTNKAYGDWTTEDFDTRISYIGKYITGLQADQDWAKLMKGRLIQSGVTTVKDLPSGLVAPQP